MSTRSPIRHSRRGQLLPLVAPADDTRPIPVVTPAGQPAWQAAAQITAFLALALAPSIAGLIFVGSVPWT